MEIKRQKSKRWLGWLGGLMILIGIGLLGAYFYWYQTGIEIVPLPKLAEVNPEVDEAEVTDEQKDDHQVAPDQPRYFSMTELGIHRARILGLGKLANGQIATPASIFDLGWYTESAKPGQNTVKSILLDGHNGGPTKDGIFKRLSEVKDGAYFTIERGDGKIFTYKITQNYQIAVDDFSTQKMASLLENPSSKPSVTIISCSGRWIPKDSTYDHRVVVVAELVDSPTN